MCAEEVKDDFQVGFESEVEDLYDEWESERKSVQRGGAQTRVLYQKNLAFGETNALRVRFAENQFHRAWVHYVQDAKENKKKKLICHGNPKILKDKSLKVKIDPDNCPICRELLQRGLKDDALVPSLKYYFRVFDRKFQKEQKENGLDDQITIIEVGPQLFGEVASVAAHSDHMVPVWEDEAKTIPVIDPKSGKQKLAIDLINYDIALKKEKTGPKDFDVEYKCLTCGPKGWYALTEDELELIANGMPNIDWFVKPSSEARINKVLFGIEDNGENAEEDIDAKVSRIADEDGRVPF
jgi:hypothetical protein